MPIRCPRQLIGRRALDQDVIIRALIELDNY